MGEWAKINDQLDYTKLFSVPMWASVACLVALLIFVSIRLRDSRVGRAWMAIREDEIAAAAMGVNRTKFKLLAFAIGAAFAGMTGVNAVGRNRW